MAVTASALRFVTYLAPSLPIELFELVAELDSDDPFAAGEFDVGFVCAPPFLWLRARRPPSVELVGAGWVFDDPRANGAPVYFSDVIVAASSAARTFADLRGGVWAYNDVPLRERVRVLESWGPHPIQPIVARSALPLAVRRALAETLLDLPREPRAPAALAAFGVRGFVPVDESLYAAERAALAAAPTAGAALEVLA
jgi:ABC-type phosphate/phosphonate transport system substrate-binding protein